MLVASAEAAVTWHPLQRRPKLAAGLSSQILGQNYRTEKIPLQARATPLQIYRSSYLPGSCVVRVLSLALLRSPHACRRRL